MISTPRSPPGAFPCAMIVCSTGDYQLGLSAGHKRDQRSNEVRARGSRIGSQTWTRTTAWLLARLFEVKCCSESPGCQRNDDDLSWKTQRKASRLRFAASRSRRGRATFYAAVKLGRQKRGLALDENDLGVAATALALGATLVSRDSDFAGIDGLQVVAPA